MSDSKQQEVFSELTEQRIERLPDDVVKVMLAGAKEELASISDKAVFVEKKTFALIAVMFSILGFSGKFLQALYEQNAVFSVIIVILMAATLLFAMLSTYIDTYYSVFSKRPDKRLSQAYYGAFFDIKGALEALEYYSEQKRRIEDESDFSRLLLLWYAESVAHNTKLVSKKSVYFNIALIALTAVVVAAAAVFIFDDINMASPQIGASQPAPAAGSG